jgi:hypothetical protein
VVSPDGKSLVEGHELGSVLVEEEAIALGATLADRLLHEGAGAILVDSRLTAAPTVTEP